MLIINYTSTFICFFNHNIDMELTYRARI
ncbi:MAG: hypothetical protein ACJAXY_001945, partial [Nonlabens sp.]